MKYIKLISALGILFIMFSGFWSGKSNDELKKEGGALNAAITVAPGIRLYKLTQNGLAIQATIQGTKYWKDGDLN